MPGSCCVPGCSNVYSKGTKLRFFSFPKDQEITRQWIKNVNRKQSETGSPWKPGPYARVCSDHFVDGYPSKQNPIPTKNLGQGGSKRHYRKKAEESAVAITPDKLSEKSAFGVPWENKKVSQIIKVAAAALPDRRRFSSQVPTRNLDMATTSSSHSNSPTSGRGIYDEVMSEDSYDDELPVEPLVPSPSIIPTTSRLNNIAVTVKSVPNLIEPPKSLAKPPEVASNLQRTGQTRIRLPENPICALCLTFGHRQICSTAATQISHVQDHLRHSAYLLGVDSGTLPTVDNLLIAKCFWPGATLAIQKRSIDSVDSRSKSVDKGAKRIVSATLRIDNGSKPIDGASKSIDNGTMEIDNESERFDSGSIHYYSGHDKLRNPPSRIVEQAPPILETEITHEPKSDPITNSIPIVGATAQIGKCQPLIDLLAQLGSAHDGVVDESANYDDDEEGEDYEEEETSEGSWSESMERSRGSGRFRYKKAKIHDPNSRIAIKREHERKNKEAVMKELIDVHDDPNRRTNFVLVRGHYWRIFISDGYRYRLARAYTSGKCQLRCTENQCKGKAIINPDGSQPYHLVPVDKHCHEPPVRKSEGSF